MKDEIKQYIQYLQKQKHASQNTILSYQRDLLKLAGYLEMNEVTEVAEVTQTNLTSYVLMLENAGLATATISRNIASIKGFFSFLFQERMIKQNVSLPLHSPRAERKAPQILTLDEIECLLKQPKGEQPKEVRDRAMLEVLYATGIRVSELISLSLDDIDLKWNYIICRNHGKHRVIPMDESANQALTHYLTDARPVMQKDENKIVFLNCRGTAMSRQGFWKIIKKYASDAGIQKEITPHMIRHSFASHLVENGADLRVVQEMLGHADLATTQMYVQPEHLKIKDVYEKTHLRHTI